MSLRNRGGKWHFRFQLDGKEYSQTTHLAAIKRNQIRAQQIELEYRQALMEGRNPSRRIVVRSFSDATEEFLAWTEMEYRQHPNSGKRIRTSLASARAFFGQQPVSLIDAARIEAYKVWRLSEHKVRDITLRHDLHALSTFFRYAMKQTWTGHNPVREVKIPSDVDAVRMHVLTAEEERVYFARAAKYPDLFDGGRLMLNQGMRPEEVINIPKSAVDLERGKLSIQNGKSTASRRTLDLTTESRLILGRRMTGQSPWIFPSRRNPGKHIGRLNSAHDRLCRDAAKKGISISWVLYDLRHSFATAAAQSGVDLATIAAILGHSSIRIVQKYVHPTEEHKREAMLRFEAVMDAARRKQSTQ